MQQNLRGNTGRTAFSYVYTHTFIVPAKHPVVPKVEIGNRPGHTSDHITWAGGCVEKEERAREMAADVLGGLINWSLRVAKADRPDSTSNPSESQQEPHYIYCEERHCDR